MGIIGSIFSGIFGSNAANHAADTQAGAANNAAALERQNALDALAFEKQVYGDQQTNQRPFLQAGQGATYSLANLLGIRMPQATASTPPFVGNPNGGSDPNVNTPDNPRTFAGRGINPLTGRRVAIPFGDESDMMQPGQNRVFLPTGSTTSFNTNPPITPSGTAQPGSILGSIIQGEGGTPGGVVNATTNQGDTGQVPRTDVGLPGSADDNSFGSLLKGYGNQFEAPTDVTEQNDPGYKFRLQQGNDAIQRSAAARGGLLSGGTAKALSDYAQGSASQEYGNVYNRALSTFDNNYNQFNNDQTNKFNRLASLAGFGQTAAGQLSTAGSNAANNVSSTLLTSGQQIGNDIQNAGAARASGYVGRANAINGAISGGTNSLDSILLSQFL